MKQRSPVTVAAAAGVFLLVTSAALSGCGDSTPEPADTPSPAVASSQPAASASSTGTTAVGSYTGTGNKVVTLPAPQQQPGLAVMTHTGSGAFSINTVDAKGQPGSVLVQTTGDYTGTVIYNVEIATGISAFNVASVGPWTLALKPVSAAQPWTGTSVSGTGDNVVGLDPPTRGSVPITLQHTGAGNFGVFAYTTGSYQTLVNKIGDYSGQAALPNATQAISVRGEGNWTLTRQ